ncbi:TetR/AcrR family transcriptional regulator [Nocardia sp. alder85J]|uniref:TetR/AcrR family transcriptional regulator n=1 Tax=Nocardia sp. alder85J TaxID=2862949 RepID=UPI001CD6FE06|nr:TetR/AcrR family transcriptional regulator [Nocardia sp. alder85J]MCX4091887.1 helix-turn-helix domain containing protein [Nocardia sp. alder85J]
MRADDRPGLPAERTREHVLACVQEILVAEGPEAVTFTAVARRARVSRNTLYRHWSARDQLLADAAVRYHRLDEAPGEATPATVLEFLRALRDALATPGTAAAFTTLAAHAEHDPTADEALRRITELSRVRLAEITGPLSDAAFARILGPLYFQALVARRPVDDDFLAELAADWRPVDH